MDWIPKDESSPANSEASGDSEADAIAPSVAMAYDNDDAESSSGGEDRGDGDVVDERIMSWRGWLVECSKPQYEVVMAMDNQLIQEEIGAATRSGSGSGSRSGGVEPAVADAESNRLFWEACLARGYP